MKTQSTKTLLACLALGIALAIASTPAAAQLQLSGEVLLPYFEVDLQKADGVNTTFAVGNALNQAVNVEATVFTNWGIAIAKSNLTLAAREVRTFNLRTWIAGETPTRRISGMELNHFKAALSGLRSPKDKLFYSSKVGEELAVGYVRIKTLGNPRPRALWGDYFILNEGQSSGEGDILLNIDPSACLGLCKRHALRFLTNEAFDGGTQVVIWSGAPGKPSSSATPPGTVQANAQAFDEDGRPLGASQLRLLPVQVVAVADLGWNHLAGWIDLQTPDTVSAVAVHFNSKQRFGIALGSYCLPDVFLPPSPGLEIEKLTNAEDADVPPGPSIPVGQTVVWDYVVYNSGGVRLTDVRVSDDKEGQVDCPKTTLEPGERMTCTLRGVAEACQYANVGSVRGKTPEGKELSAEDPSHYFGDQKAAIDIEKLTNGEDADTPTGPLVEVGSKINWTYVVTNTGEVALSAVKVVDDKGVAVSCPKTSLRPGESMTCTASGVAVEGQYKNIGSVSAETSCGAVVRDEDPSHYFGRHEDPDIEIKKVTNGHDCATAPGQNLKVGSPVRWDYVVTNKGKVKLNDIKVSDNVEGPIACPKTSLLPGESMTCSKTGVVKACQYANQGTVTATSSGGKSVTHSDWSWYVGETRPSLKIETSVNGQDADTAPGPEIPVGSVVEWTYVVTNNGDVALRDVKVADDRGVAVSCPKSSLLPGESMTCSARGTAVEGPYKNVGTATGTADTLCGGSASASDPSNYRGKDEPPGIDIKKTTNGNRCDRAPGSKVSVGGAVRWEYLVTNTGQIRLDNVQVTDDVEGPIACPKTSLLPGESMTCSKTGYAKACQYTNKGTVTATSSGGKAVTDDDLSFYFGQTHPNLDIETLVNGKEADSSPGVEVAVGSTVQWTYVVKNTGDVALRDVKVTDDRGAAVSCPKTTLAKGESMTCTASGTAVEGTFKNTGTATGTADTSCGGYASDYDPAYYYGKKESGKQGCTPGYWKNHPESWPPTGYATSQKVKSVFSQAERYPSLGYASLIEALSFQGGSDLEGAAGNLLRAAVAALLDASHPGVDYPRSASSVIQNVDAALASKDRNTILYLASSLDRDNNLGCPLN